MDLIKDIISYNQITWICNNLAEKIYLDMFDHGGINCIVAVTRGGLFPALVLAQRLGVKDIRTISCSSYRSDNTRGEIQLVSAAAIQNDPRTLIVDDLVDSGATMEFIRSKYDKVTTAVIYTKDMKRYKSLFDYYGEEKDPNTWIVFPWEQESIAEEQKQKLIKDIELRKTLQEKDAKAREENKDKERPKIVISDKFRKVNTNIIDVNEPYKAHEGFYMTKEQKEVINQIENNRHSLTLLTGKAGAGKSTIVKELLARNPEWTILSTTGRSAIIINGKTIDQFFGYDRDKDIFRSRKQVRDRLDKVGKVIIIDEASMMGLKMFESIYRICCQNNKDIILVGDWGQASPVKDEWVFASQIFLNDVHSIKLTEAHRQSDGPFLEALDKIRRGIVDDQVNSLFRSRVVGPLDEKDDSKLIIFPTNKQVNSYNQRKVEELAKKTNQEIFTLITQAINIGENIPDSRVQSVLSNSPFANGDEFCIGCKVLITRNDLTSGYVNGDTGTLVSWDSNVLEILLDRTGETVEICQYIQEVRDALDRLEFKLVGYPVKAGYAFTAHKCQGLTIPKVWVDINGISYMRAHGLCYVALSRVRHLEDLYLSSWDPKAIVCDDITKPYL